MRYSSDIFGGSIPKIKLKRNYYTKKINLLSCKFKL